MLGLQNLGTIWTLFDGSGRDWRDLSTWTGPGSVFCVPANLQWQAVSTRRRGEAAGGRFLISDKCHWCHCTSRSRRHVSAEGRHISDVRCSCMQNTTFGTYLDSQSGQNDDSSRQTKTVDRFLVCCQMPQKVPFILPILLFFWSRKHLQIWCGESGGGLQRFISHAACKSQSWRSQTKKTGNYLFDIKIKVWWGSSHVQLQEENNI